MRLMALGLTVLLLAGCSAEQIRDTGNRTLRNICQQNSQSCSVDCGVGKSADSYGQCRSQ